MGAPKLEPGRVHAIDPSKIPADLRGLDQWLVWKLQQRGKKWTKVPYQSRKPFLCADSTDRSTWSSFDAAIAALADPENKLDGIGFAFAEDGDLAGVDFDNCLDRDGNLLDWARPFLDRLVGYAEVSPSGTGIKVFVRGGVPGGKGRRKGRLGYDQKGEIEVYDRGRYFTVTSRCFGESHQGVGDGDAALAALHAEWFPKPERPRAKRSEPPKLHKTDAELLAVIARSKQARKFDALMGGSTDGYKSGSEADLALCSIIAFYWGGDIDAIDRVFRQSMLCDEKWERITYREPTTDKACNQTSFYDPNWKKGFGVVHPDDDRGDAWEPPIEGSAPAALPGFGNYHVEHRIDDEGRNLSVPSAHPMWKIDEDRAKLTGGWPRRIRKRLFIEVGSPADRKPDYLDSSAQLFAWIDKQSHVDWTKGSRFITQERFYEHLRSNVEQHDSIEAMPHVPPFPGAYYMHPELPAPSGKLNELLDRFLPATPLDRWLIAALILTPLWGGEPGTRPAFLITGPDYDEEQGRGLGKTTLVDLIADVLYDGSIDVAANEDMGAVKTRMLSAEGESKRIARLDNVKSLRFSWGDLEGMITTRIISGHSLYQGEGRRRNDLVWTITLNGASLSKDMAQRVVTVQVARPPKERIARWREDTVEFMLANRWEIIGDAAAILAKEPGPLRPATRWAAWECGVLSKLPMAAECQAAMIERQEGVDEGNNDRDLIRDALCDLMSREGHDPADALLKISSKTMAEIVSDAARKHYETGTATTFVKGLAIPELHQLRRNDFRGWLWSGPLTTQKEPTIFAPIVTRVTTR